jgi:hypothetical protein
LKKTPQINSINDSTKELQITIPNTPKPH